MKLLYKDKNMSDTIKIVGVIILILLLVVFAPFLTIWSLNTLFPVLAIPFTFDTWAAIVLLGMWVRGTVDFRKNK
jgi:hypothetical protein